MTATFLAPPQPDSEKEMQQEYERILVPRQLILREGDGSSLWIVDPDGYARRVTVRLGTAGTDVLVEVMEGVRPTDKLITSSTSNLEP